MTGCLLRKHACTHVHAHKGCGPNPRLHAKRWMALGLVCLICEMGCTVSIKGKGPERSPYLHRTCPLASAVAVLHISSAHELRWAQDPSPTACGHLPSMSQHVPNRIRHHPPHTCSSCCAPAPLAGTSSTGRPGQESAGCCAPSPSPQVLPASSHRGCCSQLRPGCSLHCFQLLFPSCLAVGQSQVRAIFLNIQI